MVAGGRVGRARWWATQGCGGGEATRAGPGQGGAVPRWLGGAAAPNKPAAPGPRREVRPPPPIDLVVARAEAGSRVVRDLVVLEAALGRGSREPPVLRHHRLFGRETADAGGAPEASCVQREAVGGEVLGLPVEHRVDRAAPALEA